MNKIYTLINYFEGSTGDISRCGDFTSGDSSYLQIHYFNDTNSIGETLGRDRFNNKDNEFTILINGINLNDCYCALDEQTINDYQKDLDNIELVASNSYHQARDIHLKALKEKEEQDKLIKQQKEKKLQQELENKEKEQLQKLMNKYGVSK